MKTKAFYIMPVLGTILLMTGCSSENDIENNATMKNITLSATTGFSDAQSSAKSSETRVSWNPNTGGTKLNGSWDASDKITVTNNSSSADFTSDNTESGATTANFNGTAAFTDGQTLYAFYPAATLSGNSATYDFTTTAALSFGSTDLSGLKAIAKYYPMYASQTYHESGETKFTFTNAASIVRLRLQAPEDGTIIKVSISGPNLNTAGTLSESGTWTPSEGKHSAGTDNYTKTITKYDEIDLYFITLPGSNVKNATVTIDYQNGEKFYYTKLPKDVTMEASKEYVYTRGYKKVSREPKIGDTYYSDGTWGDYDTSKDKQVTTSTSNFPVGIICALKNQVSQTDKDAGFSLGYVMCTKYAGQSNPWTSTTYTKDEDNIPNVSVADSKTDINGYTYQKAFMENHKNDLFQSSTFEDSKKLESAFYSAYYAGGVSGDQSLNLSDDMKATTTGWFLPSAGQVADMLVNLGNLDMAGTSSPRGGKDCPANDGLAKYPVELTNDAKLVSTTLGDKVDQNIWPHHLSDAMWYAAPNNYTPFSNTSMWTSNETDSSDAIYLLINGETWRFESASKSDVSGLVRPFLAF